MNPKTKRRSGHQYAEAVLGVLRRGGRPLGAYDIIRELAEEYHVVAPATVYRALDRLISEGRTHKIESINAFVACGEVECDGQPAFAICDCCGHVTPFAECGVSAAVRSWCSDQAFSPTGVTLEVHGTCNECREKVT